MRSRPDDLADFTRETLTLEGRAREVYRLGSGPAVVVMTEIPGITPQVATFARHVANAGFSVWMPDLFGTPGAPMSQAYMARTVVQICIRREIHLLAARHASPLTTWLRALCRHAHRACGGPGVGAVGMCVTGNFALALAVDDSVMAPVLSQPSLPVPVVAALGRRLHVSDAQLAAVRQRVDADGLTVLGLRFTGDPLCPAARFTALREALGDGFEAIEIDSSPSNPWGHPADAHSVLTTHLIDADGQPTQAALHRVLAFFRARLHPETP